jgi:predicted Fe-S protein YdhL (DUF1289 family)
MADNNSPPVTPCINVCEMDDRLGLCKGCFRTINEIAAWSGMSDEEKREIMAQLLRRRFKRQVA